MESLRDTWSLEPLDFGMPKIIRTPAKYQLPQEDTFISSEALTDSNMIEGIVGFQAVPEKLPKYFRTETILEWWIGSVIKIDHDQKYFQAIVKDIKNNIESIMEFDISSKIFEEDEDIERYLFIGSEFAFYSLVKHGRGSPEISSKIEFSSPYIWKEGDSDRAIQLCKELFPDELYD